MVHLISDIKRNGFCFTDGCGLISLGLAQEVAEKVGLLVKQLVYKKEPQNDLIHKTSVCLE